MQNRSAGMTSDLSSHVAAGSAEAMALSAWEAQAKADPEGRRAIENIHHGIRLGLLASTDVEIFGRALAAIRPTWHAGFSEADWIALDQTEQLCRRGPDAPRPTTGGYSRVMLFWALLHFNVLGRRPDVWEYHTYLRQLQDRNITGEDLDHRSQLRGRRPIVWLTSTVAVESLPAVSPGASPSEVADTLRDVLGLAQLGPGEYSWLVEVQLPRELADDTHVPTPFDGLDNPVYLPYLDPDE